MPFFNWGKKSEEDLRREERQKETLKELAQGRIPIQARERLEREAALGRNFFSSDFSAREHLLTKQAGLQTVGQVMGTSFFNVSFFGLARTRWRATGELVDVSRAQLDARRLAVSRMQQEAKLLGASGVIGVRIQSGHHEWSSSMVEFTAVGTAVRLPDWQEEEPFTSALTAQEFWLLHNAGYRPAGIAFGVCSYYIYTDAATQSILYSWFGGNNYSNQEVPLYTDGLRVARHEAMNRLTNDMYQHRADGVVGMDVSYDMEHIEYEANNRTYHDMIAHFVALGTSINKVADVAQAKTAPMMVLNLASRGSRKPALTRLESLTSGTYEAGLDDDD